MSPRTGRPVIGKPKNISLRFLIDEDDAKALEECAERLQITKSEVVRKGIQKVRQELDEKKE